MQNPVFSVASSGDGSYCVGGIPEDALECDYCARDGAVYIWARTGDASWSLQTKLQWTSMAGFGAAVAMSDSGDLIWVAAPGVDAAYAWSRSGSAWMLHGQFSAPGIGDAVALSADGQRGFAGAPGAVRIDTSRCIVS
jgi:hypothetical protein